MQGIKKFKAFSLASIIGISIFYNLLPINVQADETSKSALKEYKREVNTHEGSLYENRNVDLNIEVAIDELGIAQKIVKALKNTNISGFSRNFTDEIFSITGERYNVIIFTSDSGYKYKFNGIKFSGSANINGVSYSIWIFENGRFEKNNNNGNYAYRGWFRTNEQYIAFYR